MPCETIDISLDGSTAVITLDRPEDLNTIVPPMLEELDAAVTSAIRDREVKVILLPGSRPLLLCRLQLRRRLRVLGRGHLDGRRWDAGRDLIAGHLAGHGLGSALHVAVAQPKAGDCPGARLVRGRGSEMALCADIVIASEDARIGTPYSRMWGCHHAGIWVYRLGLARARARPHRSRRLGARGERHRPHQRGGALRRAREGDARAGAAPRVHPGVAAGRDEAGGQPGVRQHGAVLDPAARVGDGQHDAQHAGGQEFIERAASEGVGSVIAARDAPFGDYSQAEADGKPDPGNVVRAGRARDS